MRTYVAILRGINVSGHKMIKMDTLVSLFESQNCNDVKTYIQSGNVIFKKAETDLRQLGQSIEKAIVEQFGFEVPVLVIEKTDLLNVINKNPFLIRNDVDLTKLHVTFLSEEPNKLGSAKIDQKLFLPDEFIINGKTIYLFCPSGYGNTKLNNNFFENKLKVIATTRNWKTVNALVRIVTTN